MPSDEDVHDYGDVDLWLATSWSREAWKHCGSLQELIETGLGPTGRRNPLLQPSGSQTFQPTSSEAEVTNPDVTSEWECQRSIPTLTGAVSGPCANQAWI